MTDLTALSAARRISDLAALGDGRTVDVVVIGGGITGAGIALDAASRGLSVVLVEKHDLAFGTSRWSSKLVHGGLRYLKQGALHLTYESVRERDQLLRDAHRLKGIQVICGGCIMHRNIFGVSRCQTCVRQPYPCVQQPYRLLIYYAELGLSHNQTTARMWRQGRRALGIMRVKVMSETSMPNRR